MGLFVKRENAGSAMPLYNISANKTVLIVGLGNVGKEYERTRHNVGFACIDEFAKKNDFSIWVDNKDLKSYTCKQIIADTRIILIKPTTLMNNSGQAVQAIQHFYKLTNAQTIVVHDELDIPFGQIRTRVGGGSAGNNGIKSIIQHCGEDFGRIRIGIQNDHASQTDSADFVLSKFSKDELSAMPLIVREVDTLISEYLAAGTLGHETRNII